MDPAPVPAIFVIDLQARRQQKTIFLLRFSAFYFLKVHLHHFTKMKIHIEVTKQ
jgi:hypothetical protein